MLKGPQSVREGKSGHYYHHSRSQVPHSLVTDISDGELIDAFLKQTRDYQASYSQQASQAHQANQATISVDANMQGGLQSMVSSAGSIVFLSEDPPTSTYA